MIIMKIIYLINGMVKYIVPRKKKQQKNLMKKMNLIQMLNKIFLPIKYEICNYDNDNDNTFKRNSSSSNLDKDKNHTLYNEKYKDEYPKHVHEKNKKFPIIHYKINDFKYYIKNNIINKEKIDNIVEG
ncbi:hypothetical protein PFMALIP_01909 [Plasmodium falciparum MaliPS096_E11]|uniref:Uncharacterized protein n=1 Tax=Plasmodium falciparum MaliPS096_E11 TaxID=1036727 RepID=A0A024WU71_PLAFA|nr:hypothetical protein PFMALIP_01909 [Plasmodium falciparum MaliPS096_E11]